MASLYSLSQGNYELTKNIILKTRVFHYYNYTGIMEFLLKHENESALIKDTIEFIRGEDEEFFIEGLIALLRDKDTSDGLILRNSARIKKIITI